MNIRTYDVIVIGCGAAGMAAAIELQNRGYKTAVIEREDQPGGILMQCIHNGFGLHRFNEELTGPEYAERFIRQLKASEATIYCNSTAISLTDENGTQKVVIYSSKYGVMSLEGRAVVLAMGCRERTRGNIAIPGSRPAGIFTAGLAQRLLNVEGLLPGRRVVIVGSGDIGLIMARRLTWAGAKVLAVVEIAPHPSGLTRNVVQCLNDFNIPLYLSHCVSRIDGNERIERVEITPQINGKPDSDHKFELDCDTMLLSVGLIPENEISKSAAVQISSATNGPCVGSDHMTSVNGIFACGNVLHVHDLVDFVSEEAEACGVHVADYLSGRKTGRQIPVQTGSNVRYVVPMACDPMQDNVFSMRPTTIEKEVNCIIRCDTSIVQTRKLKHIQPAEMIHVTLPAGNIPENTKSIHISLDSIS